MYFLGSLFSIMSLIDELMLREQKESVFDNHTLRELRKDELLKNTFALHNQIAYSLIIFVFSIMFFIQKCVLYNGYLVCGTWFGPNTHINVNAFSNGTDSNNLNEPHSNIEEAESMLNSHENDSINNYACDKKNVTFLSQENTLAGPTNDSFITNNV